MPKIIKEGTLVYFCSFFLVLGLFSESIARALPSISLGTMFVLMLLEKDLKERVVGLFNYKPLWCVSIVFFVYLFDFFRTDITNYDFYFERLQLKVGILVFVLVFGLTNSFTKKRVYTLLAFFLFVCTCYSSGVLINYFSHFEKINESYIRSKVLPIGINHVRYSLMVSTATIFGAYLVYKKFTIRYGWETKLYTGLVAFCIVFLHVLSVRSGLLSLYTLLIVFAGYVVYQSGNKKYLVGALIGVVVFPVVAYFTVPTLQNKVKNTQNDLRAIDDAYNSNFQSLTARVYSYKVALAINQENPLLGVGSGNLKREVSKTYSDNFSEIRPLYRIFPHNQYLRDLASFGFLGVLIIYTAFYLPLFCCKNFLTEGVLLFHFVSVSLSFMFEGTMETQLGLNYTMLFIFLPLSYLKNEQHVIKKT